MERMPSKREVKQLIFVLNRESASGLDSFSRQFFQTFWEFIGEDITNMVKALFFGLENSRYITHTNLVLISKKEKVKT